jgi:hypothetical protein
MMMFTFALIVVLFCSYIFSPFFLRAFKGKRLDFVSTEIENLRLRKQMIVAAINDLEYDSKMNKMSLEDYQSIKERLVSEGSAVLQALKKAECPDPVYRGRPVRKRAKRAVA